MGGVQLEELSQHIGPTTREPSANDRSSTATIDQTPQLAEFPDLLQQHLRNLFHHHHVPCQLKVRSSISASRSPQMVEFRLLNQLIPIMTHPSAEKIRKLQNPLSGG